MKTGLKNALYVRSERAVFLQPRFASNKQKSRRCVCVCVCVKCLLLWTWTRRNFLIFIASNISNSSTNVHVCCRLFDEAVSNVSSYCTFCRWGRFHPLPLVAFCTTQNESTQREGGFRPKTDHRRRLFVAVSTAGFLTPLERRPPLPWTWVRQTKNRCRRCWMIF